MKKYIIPVTEVHKLKIETAFCLGASDTEGNGVQLGKEYDGEDGDVWE